MAPEYGATCGFFPVDEEALKYMRLTGRSEEQIDLVKTYLEENSMFFTVEKEDPEYTDVVELDLATVEASLSGPKRPQDLIFLSDMKKEFEKSVRGFKPIEVDSFLDDVISDYQKMADMNNNIKKLEEENARLKKEVEDLRIRVATNTRTANNGGQSQQIDILKRLSNIEKQVFGKAEKQS